MDATSKNEGAVSIKMHDVLSKMIYVANLRHFHKIMLRGPLMKGTRYDL